MSAAEANPTQEKMTDEERQAMMEKMDKDLEEHFKRLEERAASGESTRESVITEENWEEQLASHPFFHQEWKQGKELSPLMKGLQDLKYSPEENTPEELAVSYKEDGNFNFKCKKYRFAIASYTEGLKASSSDVLVNTQLYTNRAASQYHIGNYRSCLRDCEAAVQLTPAHFKAIVRGAQAYIGLKQFGKAVEWCDRGILLDPKHEELLKLREEAVKMEKLKERDERKRKAAEKKKKSEEDKILDIIRSRGIQVELRKGGSLDLAALEPCHPAAVHKRVHLDPNTNELVFPTLFIYPEFGEVDFIEEFRENETIGQHIEVMFGGDTEPPPWDPQRRYSPATIEMYFEDKDENLQSVPHNYTLIQVMTVKGFLLKAGTPALICFARNSEAHKDYLKKYNVL